MLQRQSYAKNVIFFLKKRMKENFAFVLESMLTYRRMQNNRDEYNNNDIT